MFWFTNGLNELPVVRFKSPFILIDKLTMAFLKGQSTRISALFRRRAFTLRPSTRRCPSFSSGLAEMIRKYSVLWETSITVKHLIKKASPALLNFTKSTARLGLGYMTFPEMLETMHENDLFDMLPVFSNVVHILGVIPFTLCSAERSFSVLHRLKTYLRTTMGNNVSVTSHLLTLKGHMPTL